MVARRRRQGSARADSVVRRRSRRAFTASTTPSKSELIGATHTIEEIREFLEADSVGYLSLDGMLSAVNTEKNTYCTSCYTGVYPVAFPRDEGDLSATRAENSIARASRSPNKTMTRTPREQRAQRKRSRVIVLLCPLFPLCPLFHAKARGAQEPAAPQTVSPAQLQAAITKLGEPRLRDANDGHRGPSGARRARRPCRRCVQAVSEQADGYVRYRALVLLTGLQRSEDEGRDARVAVQSPTIGLRTVGLQLLRAQPRPRNALHVHGGAQQRAS